MVRRVSQTRRPNGAREMPVRSMRIDDSIWNKAKLRADHEGMTMSNVGAQLIEGYALGLIDTPKHQRIYAETRQAPEVAS